MNQLFNNGFLKNLRPSRRELASRAPVLTVSLIELREGGYGKHWAFRAGVPRILPLARSSLAFFSPSLPLFAPATAG